MPTFSYTAREINTAKARKGLVEAATSVAALTLLRNQGLVVSALAEKREEPFSWQNLVKVMGVSSKDLFTFTRELATMVSSGLAVSQALRILAQQTKASYFRKVLESILHDVESGVALSKSLEKHPQVFNVIYVSLVRSGELSGTLDKVLERLAINLEKERELRGKVIGALVYPAIIVTMMLGVMIIMLIFVIPKLTDMFASMNLDLPLTTKILIWSSKFLVTYWWLVILVIVSLIALFNNVKKTPLGRRYLDTFLFKLPVFGHLLKISQLAEFTRDLGVLVASGIPIMEALKSARGALRNSLLQQTIDLAVTGVGKGQPLSQIIAADPIYPAIIPQMLSVGEETGRVDKVLLDVSRYFESETDFAVKNMSAALEPLIMVVLGAGVGLLIISIITPIYKLTSSF